MLKNYTKELVSIAVAFGLISYTVYVCAAEPVTTKPVAVVAKKAAKPVKPAKPAEVKKEHAKKPTLKAKFADKK